MLEKHRREIEQGSLRVLMADECHLLWGDLLGYIWGKTDQEIALPISNERLKQTYFGAVDILSGQTLIQDYPTGNSAHTVSFLNYLQAQSPNQRLLIFWDGASYHCSHQIKDFLAEVNQGRAPDQWLIHLVNFAPNCPEQNPIEDVWLQAKNWVRRCCRLVTSFPKLKSLFEEFLQNMAFEFPKLHMYGSFSTTK